MSYAAKVIADSLAGGVRLTTLEVTMPRIVLAEFNTHRVFSRNSASSRAIPVAKRIQAVIDDPFIPATFGSNKKGMQAGDALEGAERANALDAWMVARDNAVRSAYRLAALGVHKQLANRLLEPFSWHTVVVTATEWENFFNLRISSLAQPEIRTAAELMKAAMDASKPRTLDVNGWHLPYVSDEDHARHRDRAEAYLMPMTSAARCARVSYLTHDGRRDVDADLRLADDLAKNRHMSPFEHVAYVDSAHSTHIDGKFIGNFRAPWVQLRKTMAGEDVAPREEQS